jgi:hypothetical protein
LSQRPTQRPASLRCPSASPIPSLLDLALGVAVDVLLGVLLEAGAVVLVLVGDAGLERVVGLGLDQQVPHGLEHALDAAGGLPVLRLEYGEADVAHGVVGDVGVVDARREVDHGRLERVVVRQRQRQVERPALVRGALRARQRDVPLVYVRLVVGDRDVRRRR